MKVESMVVVRAEDRYAEAFHRGVVVLSAASILLLAVAAHAADPRPGSAGKSAAVTFESIPGSNVKRVILTAKAAERLGIETGKVGEEPVVRKQMVSGLVIPPMEKQPEPPATAGRVGGQVRGAVVSPSKSAGGSFASLGKQAVAAKPAGGSFGGFGAGPAAPMPKPAAGTFASLDKKTDVPTTLQPVPAPVRAPATGEVWILVTLSPAELERLAKDKPARLLPLATRDKFEYDLVARPSGMPPLEDMKRSMLSLYYVVPGKDHGLAINNRMRVELQVLGSEEKQKVVPYSAVYYDGKGTSWVYTNPKPLEFERKRIRVERVVGDLAVLSEGPAVGTNVVTIGAALLYGAEIFGK
jgi:hypothetical protein